MSRSQLTARQQQEAQRPMSDLITNYMVGLSSGITNPLNPSKLKEAENDLLPKNGQFFGLSTLFLNLPQNMGIGLSNHFLTTQIQSKFVGVPSPPHSPSTPTPPTVTFSWSPAKYFLILRVNTEACDKENLFFK